MAVVGARAIISLGLLLVVSLSGCSKEAALEDQEVFYVAYGSRGSGYFARGVAEPGNSNFLYPRGAALNGTDVKAIDSCLIAEYVKEPVPQGVRGPANPFYKAPEGVKEPPLGRNFGRTEAAAMLPGGIATKIDFTQFSDKKPWMHGGVRFNFDAFGTKTEAPMPLPQVPVQLASWGRATIESDDEPVADPAVGRPRMYNPETDELNWTADFYLLKSGLRHNDTKALHARSGGPFDPARPDDAAIERGDLEAHLLLYSTDGTPKPSVRTFQGPQPVATDRPHSRTFTFFNGWFPGRATLVYRVTTSAPDLQLTDLTFTALDPGGNVLSRTRMGGGSQPTETKTVSFPLDQPRDYLIQVAGNATLATYDIRATFVGESSLLWFWWEDVYIGEEYGTPYLACHQDITGGNLRPLPLVVDSRKPPGLAVIYLVLGVAAACLYGLFVTKLVMDQVSMGDFKRRFRKR